MSFYYRWTEKVWYFNTLKCLFFSYESICEINLEELNTRDKQTTFLKNVHAVYSFIVQLSDTVYEKN